MLRAARVRATSPSTTAGIRHCADGDIEGGSLANFDGASY